MSGDSPSGGDRRRGSKNALEFGGGEMWVLCPLTVRGTEEETDT